MLKHIKLWFAYHNKRKAIKRGEPLHYQYKLQNVSYRRAVEAQTNGKGNPYNEMIRERLERGWRLKLKATGYKVFHAEGDTINKCITVQLTFIYEI